MNLARTSIALFFNRIALVAGLLLVVFLVLMLVGRSLIPTPEQREALSLMTAPAPPQEGSAWPALRLLGYDLDPEQLQSAWDAERAALLAHEEALRTHVIQLAWTTNETPEQIAPPVFESPLVRFARPVELGDLPRLECFRAPEGCGADVVERLEALAPAWAAHSALRQRLRVLADSAHANAPEQLATSISMAMPPGGPGVLPVSLLLTDAALLWHEDPTAGLALGCRLHAAGRHHAQAANNLLTRSIAQRLVRDSARLTTDLIAQIDPALSLPNECQQLVKAPSAELGDLCASVQGEFRLNRTFEALVFDGDGHQTRGRPFDWLLRSSALELHLHASALAPYCRSNALPDAGADRPTGPDASGSKSWPERLQCLSALGSCLLASTQKDIYAPVYRDYLVSARDDVALAELFSATLALRQPALRGEDLAAIVAGMNAGRESQRPFVLADDLSSISIELSERTRRTERNWLPLPGAQTSP